MKKLLTLFLVSFTILPLSGQSYNPFVSAPAINPVPLKPVELNGTGTITFDVGNTGDDPLVSAPDSNIVLTITLSQGEPDGDPISVIGGGSAGLFNWTYAAGIYTGIQNGTISANSSGSITIPYRVTINSTAGTPRNGFTATVTVPTYQSGINNSDDDLTSAFTYTEARDYGDAPVAYGEAYHSMDFQQFLGIIIDDEDGNQPSSDAAGDDNNGQDDEDGVTFPAMIRGTTVNITVKVVGQGYLHAWIDWNIDGDFNDADERIINNAAREDETDNFPVQIPANALISGPTFARFRFGPRNLGHTGSASSGEVEDYRIIVLCNKPPAPNVGTITQPTCLLSTGSVVLNNLPSGSWTLTRNPGGETTLGSGSSYTVSGLSAGTYTFRVTNSDGCISDPSGNVVINTPPSPPQAPDIGTITQPTCAVSTGSVILNGLPSSGTWTLTRTPGNITTTGTGTSTTISGLLQGTYTFTVTSIPGCTSSATGNIVINAPLQIPSVPNQSVDCSLGYGHGLITVSSPVGTGLEYRLNDGPYQSSTQFAGVENGDYTVTVRNAQGCTATGNQFTVFCTCVNGPIVTLSSLSGQICGTANSFTLSGNTFSGATEVTISENGAGSLNTSLLTTSPFSFTYTPAAADAGRTVTITVTTNNPQGYPCVPATATYSLNVIALPSAPGIGTITHPTCLVTTGSVILNSLPSSGTWTLTRTPGDVTTTGTGTSTTISGLSPETFTFTVTNSSGCTSAQSLGVVINPQPPPISAPVIGAITHPTCTNSNGSVVLSGLPASGTWTLQRNPGGVIISGTGTTRTIVLPEGTHTFTVTNAAGCSSLPSAEVVINEQPSIPSAPSSGGITQPTCSVSTGIVVLNGLPATGNWTITRYPGTITTTGTGPTSTMPGLATGTYNFTVTNAAGCTSPLSSNIIIIAQPVTPTAPVVGTITQPTCIVPSGSVNMTGLPATGIWTLTRTPGNLNISGTGTSTTVGALMVGTYSFTVTNSAGCQSLPSGSVSILPNPSSPTIVISQPDAVCFPSTVDLTSPSITSGSTAGLTYSYWTDPAGTIPFNTPTAAPAGTYYIKGITETLCSDIKSVTVDVRNDPEAIAGTDQVLEYQFSTTLNAVNPDTGETGTWSVIRGSGRFDNSNSAITNVNGLSVGENKFLWVVTNEVCTPAVDTMSVTVNDLTVPTLITPNNDGKNDFLVIKGIELQEEASLTIFDRRGIRVFEDLNYDNTWDGIDENGEPLPDDTYFYIIQTAGRNRTGFLVIRR